MKNTNTNTIKIKNKKCIEIKILRDTFDLLRGFSPQTYKTCVIENESSSQKQKNKTKYVNAFICVSKCPTLLNILNNNDFINDVSNHIQNDIQKIKDKIKMTMD